jgi:hypothetical protein
MIMMIRITITLIILIVITTMMIIIKMSTKSEGGFNL